MSAPNLDIVFLIGPQGSGKGTQAKVLADRLGFYYWEMGGICREVAAQDSMLGKQARDLHDQGILFPDEFIFEIVKARLAEIPSEKGIVFDGIPRRLNQAKFLMDYLKNSGHQVFTTVFLSLPIAECLARSLRRAELEHRADDTREKIEYRIAQYEEETIPALDFLRTCTSFHEIDGLPPIAEVENSINRALGLV